MKKLMVRNLSRILIMLLCASAVQVQAQQESVSSVLPRKCESPFYARLAAPGEDFKFANDPIVQNFWVTQRAKPNALAEAVQNNDKTLVPYLEYRADVREDAEALLALIKLGDETRFNKLVSQTRCVEEENADDYGRQLTAITLLAYLKTPAAYRVLYNLLNDTVPLESKGHVRLLPRSNLVMSALFKTVKTSPELFLLPDGRAKPDEQQRLIWQQWFKTNKLVD